jgi:hypothetical protein
MKKEINYAYIDSQNLKLGVERDLGWKLDYKRSRVYLKEKYNVEKAYLFLGYIPENQDMYSKLQECGYILNFRPVLVNKQGEVKGNVDADLVLQAMIDYNKKAFKRAVIITSDGDFYCLVKYFYKNDRLEKVISPYVRTCSALLKKTAREKLVFLDNLKKKLEYKKRKRKSTA